jgi:LacI family transcriptional regulator, galactose operon repressor
LAPTAGSVAIFVGSHRYLDHDTREFSLRSYLRELAPGFGLLEPLVDLEQPEVAYDAALPLLRRHPELAGIYSLGGGTDGIIQTLLEEGARGRDRDCNELTQNIRSALIDRVVVLVITTPTAVPAERTIRAMHDAAAPPATAPRSVAGYVGSWLRGEGMRRARRLPLCLLKPAK